VYGLSAALSNIPGFALQAVVTVSQLLLADTLAYVQHYCTEKLSAQLPESEKEGGTGFKIEACIKVLTV